MDNKYGYSKSRDYLRNKIYNAKGDDQGRIENLKRRIDLNPQDEQNYLVLIYRYSEQNNKKVKIPLAAIAGSPSSGLKK